MFMVTPILGQLDKIFVHKESKFDKITFLFARNQ
jgi:hypothetical protein